MFHQEVIRLAPGKAGLHEFTRQVESAVGTSGVRTGLCHVFVRHTSASLVIQENADPSARRDLERWLARLVPEDDPIYTHTQEGPDDMPAHVRSVLTQTALTVPISDGRLDLGTWQGIYVWEHRHGPHNRAITVTVQGDSD